MPTTPTPTPPPRLLVPVENISDRLPGLNLLPDDIRPLVVIGINLLLLLFLFVGLRSILVRSIRTATDKVANREDNSGNHGRAARLRTLAGLMNNILVWTMGFVFAVSGLAVLRVDTTPIWATGSIIGLALGLGSQKLAKDLINGFFLLLEDQFAVGDYVTISGVTGTVEELAMRTTIIRDDDGKLYILSNGDIGQVCNQSRGPVSGSFEISIGSSADVQQATDVLNTALEKASEELKLAQAAHVAGVSGADAGKTLLKITFRTSPGVRPSTAILTLRHAARTALLEAQIPLGAA